MFIEKKRGTRKLYFIMSMNDLFEEPLSAGNEVCEISCEELDNIKAMAAAEIHMYEKAQFQDVPIHSELLF